MLPADINRVPDEGVPMSPIQGVSPIPAEKHPQKLAAEY